MSFGQRTTNKIIHRLGGARTAVSDWSPETAVYPGFVEPPRDLRGGVAHFVGKGAPLLVSRTESNSLRGSEYLAVQRKYWNLHFYFPRS